MGNRVISLLLSIIVILCLLTGCGNTSNASNVSKTDKPTFTILSGSENQTFEPILQEYAKKNNINIVMHYKGSVDIMQALSQNKVTEDAVWPANSIWLSMGDTQHKIKYSKSIATSPVIFGIKKSKAQELGFVGKKVGIKDILEATKAGKLHFMMTSASQSNSGASAFIGFLYSMLGNPASISLTDLDKPALKDNMKNLLLGVNRSSGSSDWLKDLFLKGDYEAMVNYESLIIEANQTLTKEGKEPLYAIYPYDGLTIADSPLGYLDKGDTTKEAQFKLIQSYLLSSQTQNKILALGRRTGFGGNVQGADLKVFNPAWGIDVNKTLSPIRYPDSNVIMKALNLYQSSFRKPSYVVFCIDYSGSMESNGGSSGVKQAMNILLNQEKAKQYMLQLSPDDKVVVMPFNSQIINTWSANGNSSNEISNLLTNINDLQPNGGTDIYSPAIDALKLINGVDLNKYIPSVVLMTDGQSNTGKNLDDLKNALKSKDVDIPIFAITFGEADDTQLNDITNLTRGKVFNGKSDLINAFKQVRGYN